jgi:predicted TIM-barrel fold metal-dependent hydrolase
VASFAAGFLTTPTVFSVEGGQLGELLALGAQEEKVLVETSRLTALGAVAAAVRHLGVDRVLFGTGAPLRPVGAAVMSVQYAEISDADRTAIFEGNAQRLLKSEA